MIQFIKKIFANEKMRYLIAGGCTTAVNLVTFFLLRLLTPISRNTCNAIAIAMAIAFAYFANKFFVFQSKKKGFYATLIEAVQFVGARLVSMVVEILGLAILCDTFRVQELVSKVIVQVIVFVLNYVFSKLIVFKEKKNFQENLQDNWCYYLSFAIVAVVMLVVCIAEQVAPFGENSLTLIDSVHQYLPFFSELRDKLLHEGSLLYTWNVALGSNFVSLGAYYLMSPFNLLLLVFGKEQITAVTCFLMCLKIALTAVTMVHFLSYKDGKKKRSFLIVAISVCYALSNYVIGYNWNTMWLDCIMIFPLVMLGFARMMEEHDPKLYVLSLFYALYCNYYIGYIICLFLVLWFFVYGHKTFRRFLADGVRFAVYSLLAGGMAAFVLLPAYQGIMATAAGDMNLPKGTWYGNVFVLLRQLLAFTKPITNQTFDGGVNLYCGMLAVFGMFLYLFVREHPWTKFRKYLLLVLLVVSFNHETLNYIWHGMHDQYGIPNRFSFVFIFVLLIMTYDAVSHIAEIDNCFIISAVLLSCAFVFACREQAGQTMEKFALPVCLVLLIVYGCVCMMRSSKRMQAATFISVVGSICLVEVVANAAYGFMDNGYCHYKEYYQTSPAVTEANARVRELAEEEGAGFYRSELMQYTVLDEASWHNMPSVSTFNSTVLGSVVTTMGKLGFYTGANEFLYRGATPFTNALFDVRYLLERPGDLNNFDYTYKETQNNVSIYENPYSTSLGFAVNSNTKDFVPSDYTAANAQNILAYDMTGYGGFFSEESPAISVSSDTASVNYANGQVKFTPNASGAMYFMVSFTADRAGDYYVNCRGNYVTKLRFYKNGQEIAYDRYQLQLFHIGQLEAGDYISVEYEYNNINGSEVAPFSVYTFHHQVFENVYNTLTRNLLAVDTWKDGYVKGTVTIPEGKTLFTSIPYDEGWTVKVDGEAVPYYKIVGAFIGVDMTPGEHTVEFTYMPKGLLPGMLISVICMIVLMAAMQVEKRLAARKCDDTEMIEAAVPEEEKKDEKLQEEVETDIENLEDV